MSYDFFIAYASPDRGTAEGLYYALMDRGRTCFFDRARIPLGVRWDQVLLDGIGSSQVVVVLVSAHCTDAHYQQEEIVRAVARARAPGSEAIVIPVHLDAVTLDKVPYGLAIIQGLHEPSRDVDRLSYLLDRGFPVREPESKARSSFRQVGATLRLDRTKQWGQLVDAAQRPENTLFLCHGPQDQSVNLFVERIHRFFAQEVREPRAVRRASFRMQDTTPVTGEEWLSRLRDCIDCQGPLATCLSRIVQKEKQLFVILGEIPLPIDDLSPRELAALRDFVSTLLPKLLKDARLESGVAVMLAVDYLGDTPAALDELIASGQEAQRSQWIRFRPLPPATLPDWEDIADYLVELDPPVGAARVQELMAEYAAYSSRRSLTFDMLAQWVDRKTL